MIGNIEFRDVQFRYVTRPTLRVLRNFSLDCAPSGTTALVGPSGSGKSTTIALLERFYDPLKGKVLLDGCDIKVLNIRWLRSLIGLVQQEPVLFNLSIRDNIAYGDNSRQVTQAEIESAARMANIHEMIVSLPSVSLVRVPFDAIWQTDLRRATRHCVEPRAASYQADRSKEVSCSLLP